MAKTTEPVYGTYERTLVAFKRFLRVVVPQLPGIIVIAKDWVDVKYMPLFVFGGAIVTALDKMLRDLGWY